MPPSSPPASPAASASSSAASPTPPADRRHHHQSHHNQHTHPQQLLAPQPPATLLREHQEEFERLRIDSFNKALRINFLEERLLRYTNGTAFESEDLENEVFQLRVAVRDRENELKHKSHTILRATEYVKELHAQLGAAEAELERLRAQRQQHESAATTASAAAAAHESAAQLRVELQHALEREQSHRRRLAQLEDELGSHQDTVASVTAKHHALQEEAARDAERLRAALQTADTASSMELEQWRAHLAQRDEDIARLKEQLAQLAREKEAAESRHQSKLQRMEAQVQAQLETLKRESETYGAEHTLLVTERERSALDADAARQETARAHAELERLARELELATGDAEALRLQNVKLAATCEHKSQTLDAFRKEREDATSSFGKLEEELRQWRSACSERDERVASLEHRAQDAEDEVARVTAKLERAMAQTQQSSNERLQSLERERQSAELETSRLEKELAALQHECEALEVQLDTRDKQLAEESALVRELKEQLVESERELQQRSLDLEQSEQRRAEATVLEQQATALEQQAERADRLTIEKNELLQALHEEQEHADAMERNAVDIEKANALLKEELEAIVRELSAIGGHEVRASGDAAVGYASVVPQLREAIKSARREYEAQTAALERTWRQQTDHVTKQLDQLTNQLHSSEGKLEILQRTTVHVKDGQQESERSWSTRYEKLRAEKESERRTLETELRDAQAKVVRAESALSQAKRELDALSRANDGARADSERSYHDLKESNRLLYEEVQECRRAVEHARKQHRSAVRENKDLLGALDVYKSAVAEREKDIERYKSALMKNAQQLQRRVSMGDVKQTLLEQLEHTQYMISETYKRWSESELGGASDRESAVIVHLDEYIGRMEIVTERWHEFVSQTRELQRRYGDAWRNAAHGAERPAWGDDVARKASRLLNESVRVSETLRDVVENMAGVIQRERNERKAFRSERAADAHKKLGVKDASRSEHKEWLEALDARSNQHQHGVDVSKTRGSLARNSSRRPSTVSAATNLLTGGAYRQSLSNLSRLDSELQEIEKKIKSYQE